MIELPPYPLLLWNLLVLLPVLGDTPLRRQLRGIQAVATRHRWLQLHPPVIRLPVLLLATVSVLELVATGLELKRLPEL